MASEPATTGPAQGGHAAQTANRLPDASDQLDQFSGLELLIRQLDAEVRISWRRFAPLLSPW